VFSSAMMAQVVMLRTGKSVEGVVLVHNEEVVILQTNDGRRFQYPAAEVLSVQERNAASDASISMSEIQANTHFAARVQLHAGAVYLPMKGWGGQVAMDMALGTNQIKQTPVFLGASVGYRAKCFVDQIYSFIPLQVVLYMPLKTFKHTPSVGFSLGYGISATSSTDGGICLGLDVGWNYSYKRNKSISLGANVEWQQTQTDVLHEIFNPNTGTSNQYVNHIGAGFLTIGTKLAIQF
jgi:hypothetical protein